MCVVSLGLEASPPKGITSASVLSVDHTCPGPIGTLPKPSMPLARYILKLCNVTRLARSLNRVFSSSCSGTSGSTSPSPA